MTQRVYAIEETSYDETFRIVLTSGTELTAEEWRRVLDEAYTRVRMLDVGEPAQLVVAAAAWLVGHGTFEYADEIRG